MTESVTVFKETSKSALGNKRWQLYCSLGIVTNLIVWGTALLVLKAIPVAYSSKFTITLPPAGSNSSVNLPNIGAASYESSSPFSTISQDPRENYKLIAQSEAVLNGAASQLNMTLEEFGKPKLKIIANSSLMDFEFQGKTPEEARTKSWIFYRSLEARLKTLRSQELTQRESSYQPSLNTSKWKVDLAQKRLSDFQSRSGLSSNEQIRDLSVNIEQLRRQRAEILGQYDQATGRLSQLSKNLNLSTQQATEAFTLDTDQLLQQYIKDYATANANLVNLSSSYTADHPAIVSAKAKRDAARTALLSRGQLLLGRPVTQEKLQQSSLNVNKTGSAREGLFQQLVDVKASQQGLGAQAQQLSKQINELEYRLKFLTQQESTLAALRRELQVAETVFSSTVARLDLSKGNIFASYPLIQIIAEPEMPEKPSSDLKKKFVLLGAAACSIFSTNALVLLWLRRRKTEGLEELE